MQFRIIWTIGIKGIIVKNEKMKFDSKIITIIGAIDMNKNNWNNYE